MMFDIDYKLFGDEPDDRDNLTSIPLASAAERASFDVAKETEILYQIHLWNNRDIAAIPNPTGIHKSTTAFRRASVRWWSMTGGWENVDKSIRKKYDNYFIAAVKLHNDMVPAVNAMIRSAKQRNAKEKADAALNAAATAAGFKPTCSIPEVKRPFDAAGATEALYRVAQRAVFASGPEIEMLFETLADIWWKETGGPERVGKRIMSGYPSWFIGKLELFKVDHEKKARWHSEPGSASGSQNCRAYDIKRETQHLFELARKRFPRAPNGLKDRCPSMQLELGFQIQVNRWCQMTGGWDKIDQAIRQRYPKWFVDHVADTNKKLPLAKLMGLDQWAKRTIVK
ncbi:hypothetical protein PSEUBRA_000826 [Kalmanozyma brasiliensis GHG001]|uniref:uncharacterized protein n=1 Tax=Kalmanozyma brasiliensis (strain GHG001) TaxID=1365824 RepID=UPI0028681F70|nr:uncharacterized protein PSEUBRA_000826 [Kalmanozyma brasiliensis GHG001]KAF6766847.1 hypothetical protein PSEUBRA_000826 [Kalmanozyma brasiliensis GHG001]